VRLGEATTPLVDKVIAAIKADAGRPTAKTCRSVISGVMGLAVRYGAVSTNPVREVERIEVVPRKAPRSLTSLEITAWLGRLGTDEKAVRKDLPDLTLFMLATGVRIGEALAVMWDQVDFDGAEVEITHTVIRVKGQGLLRKPTKSRAGERLLGLPTVALAVLRRRFMAGGRLDLPVFPDSLGAYAILPTLGATSGTPGERLRWRGSPERPRRPYSTVATSLRVRSRTSSVMPGRR
jgi:integrase